MKKDKEFFFQSQNEQMEKKQTEGFFLTFFSVF